MFSKRLVGIELTDEAWLVAVLVIFTGGMLVACEIPTGMFKKFVDDLKLIIGSFFGLFKRKNTAPPTAIATMTMMNLFFIAQ